MRIISANMNVIIKACEKASKTLIRDFGEIEKLQVSVKGPSDYVSSADKKVEENIITMKVKNFNFLLLESKQRIQAKSFHIHQPFFLLLNCEKLDLISYS